MGSFIGTRPIGTMHLKQHKTMGWTNLMHSLQITVRRRYNAANFLTNIHKRHPIARPLGWGVGCLLWIQHLIDILPVIIYLVFTILDRVLAALDCTLWREQQMHNQTACKFNEIYCAFVVFNWCSAHDSSLNKWMIFIGNCLGTN